MTLRGPCHSRPNDCHDIASSAERTHNIRVRQIDGTWPWLPLKAVRLLGGGSIPFKWSAAAGLVLTVQPGLVVAAPYAAVFKLDYSEAGNAAAAVGL